VKAFLVPQEYLKREIDFWWSDDLGLQFLVGSFRKYGG